jgi:KH/beta-lactamase-domain protein
LTVQTSKKKEQSVAERIRKTILSLVPPEAKITTIEFEGPEIAIYVANPKVLMEQTGVIKEIAKNLRKRVVVRTDPSIRMNPEDAKRVILEIVPREAEIKAMEFDDVLGDVVIKAEKPGLVIGKMGVIRKEIILRTGWRPNVIRAPPTSSKILDGILAQLIDESSYRRSVLREIGERIHRPIILGEGRVKIIPLGGFREVGRSAILVETPESKILLDAGASPGSLGFPGAAPRFDIDEFKLEELDAVIISHAHLDHCGMLPLLFKYGYEGPVYTTRATRDIMTLIQIDYLDVASKEGTLPPYSMRDIKKAILHTITIEYDEVTDIAPDVRLTFYDAGHILGSAMVHLHIGNGLHNIVYTGDFRYAKTRLLNRAHDDFPRVETLIMESTYGAKDLPDRTDAEQRLIEILKKTIERGGRALIPVMAVGRGQEILLILANAFDNKLLPEVPVYIEGMIGEVTAIHTHYPELLSQDVMRKIYAGENPFHRSNFVEVTDKNKREEIASDGPAIIIATSGMLNGGPSVEYFKLLSEDARNSLIFVAYQVAGTLGRKIKDGAREVTLLNSEGKLEALKINLEVHSVEGFSGHSDRTELLNFLSRMRPKPKTIVLNHGEPESIDSLASTIRRSKQRLGLPNEVEVYSPDVLWGVRLV